ncbi:cupin domain-containing protein [Rhodobacteraceae bacterium IMCC15231]|nr:cupin domain-containing protein [Rhodobacteraceae bacterium IMCC15231]
MPKIDLSCVPVETGQTWYPAPYQDAVAGLELQPVSRTSGLTQFAANLVRLAPGAKSSLRHWHVQQDEFVLVTEGTLTLIEEDGAVELGAGECAAFPAGLENGHHLVNRSRKPATFLVIGTQSETETAYYADIDMMVKQQDGHFTFSRKNGDAIAPKANRSSQ